MDRMPVAEYRAMLARPQKRARAHKYGAVRKTVDGHRFPSLAEARRYGALKMLLRAGLIRRLTLQPRFELVPSSRAAGSSVTVRAIVYVADFAYDELKRDGSWAAVVEDVKGALTPVYRMKRKLFRRAFPGVDFREIKKK